MLIHRKLKNNSKKHKKLTVFKKAKLETKTLKVSKEAKILFPVIYSLSAILRYTFS